MSCSVVFLWLSVHPAAPKAPWKGGGGRCCWKSGCSCSPGVVFPLCLVKHVTFGSSLSSCVSDELDIGPLGDFWSGGHCLCRGISSLEGSGAVSVLLPWVCHCSCHLLSPFLCPDAAACPGFQTLKFATSWGRNALTEDISDCDTGAAPGWPFLCPFCCTAAAAALPRTGCAGASRSIPIPVVSVPPLQVGVDARPH